MKNQSKNLMKYLADNGLLDSSDEAAIAAGKVAYRRLYKRNWKKNLKKSKELRPTFTKTEFSEIVERAKLYELSPTTFSRETILNALKDIDLVPNREQLMYSLQAVSMAEISLAKGSDAGEARALLLQAEETLLKYLNIKGR